MAYRTRPKSESAKAAEAFAAYIAMGPKRSLDALARSYQDRSKVAPTRDLSTLKAWSKWHRWQERIADAINAKTRAALDEAAEIDGSTFLATSRLLADVVSYTTFHHPEVVVKVRESVRVKTPVQVNVRITVEAAVERVAAELGVSASEVIAEAERIMAEARS